MSGEVYCWGGNTHGQLGTGTTSTTPSLSPVKVQNLAGPVAAISLGNAHTCALMPRPAASRDGSVRDSLAVAPVDYPRSSIGSRVIGCEGPMTAMTSAPVKLAPAS